MEETIEDDNLQVYREPELAAHCFPLYIGLRGPYELIETGVAKKRPPLGCSTTR